MASIPEQSPSTTQPAVFTPGAINLEPLERREAVPGFGYNGVVERILHDSPIGGVLRTGGALLRRARWLLRHHSQVTLLGDRGFANRPLLHWLKRSPWHYCLRVPGDTVLHGPRRAPVAVKKLFPPRGEAIFYRGIGLWREGCHHCNLVLATVDGATEPWAVITDEAPTLQTLWRYGLRFGVEELFLDSKSGAFHLEDSHIRSAPALERLYLVAAIALLYGTTTGMAVQVQGLRRQVDPHWRRGLSYLKIGLRWLRGVAHKGRQLLAPVALLPRDPEPCFASQKAEDHYYDQIWFSRIRSLSCGYQ